VPGLLDGYIAKAVYAGFKGRLSPGLLRRSVATSLDDLGDPVSPTTADYDCQGFVDDYSAVVRAKAGIPVTDVKVCIFGQSLAGGSVRPTKDDVVRMPTRAGVVTWHQLRERIEVDPAGALYECQAFVIPEPA
jgi:hypothetical protein